MVLLRVIVTSIVLAVLGVAYLLVNPHDGSMLRFGWSLVVLGSVLAGVFTYLWVRKMLAEGDEDQGEDTSPTKGAKASKGRR